MKARGGVRPLKLVEPERRVGLVVRVSTDRQALNPEGSLKNQLQRLRQHAAYKRDVAGEVWEEVAVYELKGISGKDSVRSAEFEQLYADIRAGRINTVMVTSLERLCRSVKDFLSLFEFLNEHHVEFVSLKQQYDTTSPQGKLFVTILMALAEFEREQTSERTREAAMARAERGLWNGGRVIGYDLDPDRKGYLVPNEDEAALVNFAFDTYLEVGGIALTAEALNARGYRTKAYQSRRGVEHAGGEFKMTTVRHMLANVTYIGQKTLATDAGETVIDAVWPGIVDAEKFARVQQLLALNGRVHRSQGKPVRHVHVLSGGLLACGRCGGKMEGRSGTGRQGKTYFYYACTDTGCGMRVVAEEVEGAVVERIGCLAMDAETLAALVQKTNRSSARRLSGLEKQLRSHLRALKQVSEQAGQLLATPATDDSRMFLQQQMRALALRREELERAIVETEGLIAATRTGVVTEAAVRDGLANFGRVFAYLKPYEQRELIRLVLHRVVLGDHELVLEIYGGACTSFAQAPESANNGQWFAERAIWLREPGENPNHFAFSDHASSRL